MRGGVHGPVLCLVAVFRVQPGVWPRGRVRGAVVRVVTPVRAGVPPFLAVGRHGVVDAGRQPGDRVVGSIGNVCCGVGGAADRRRRRVVREHGRLAAGDRPQQPPQGVPRGRPRRTLPLRLRRADAGVSGARDGGRVGRGGRGKLHQGGDDGRAGGLPALRAATAGVLHAQGQAGRDHFHGNERVPCVCVFFDCVHSNC